MNPLLADASLVLATIVGADGGAALALWHLTRPKDDDQ